ncbi:hypothetical protein OG741_24785 [Streptomyces sp. NBC_01410]|uniref:hypothetical protein n=1 Tax=Streptomyces sp. NBC_01410 TaxID=2903856 RepID=UPI003245EEE2
MADEQFEWLDREAAERMLRGEPVEASDEHARIQAARLSRALYEAGRNESLDYAGDGEMPGEAAALAAFRKARADAAAPAGEAVGAVRLAPSHRRPARRSRFGRPVRFGLVAAVAGCALGGAAVAATTGLLPSPFSGDPLPASSVSAAATPEPLVSDSPTGGGAVAPPYPSGSPSTPLSPSPSDGTGAPDPAVGGTDGNSGQQRGDEDKSRQQREEWYRKTADACRDYRSGHIAPDIKRRLEAAAKGAGRIERFCDQLLGGDTQGSGDGGGESGTDSGSGSSSGDSNDSDGGAGKFSGGSQSGSASVPPVAWTPAPSESVPSPPPSAPLFAL